MIDIKLIRENAEAVQQNCTRRGYPVDIAGLLKLDTEARQLNQEIEELRQALAMHRKPMSGNNRRYAPRARVNRTRIYR